MLLSDLLIQILLVVLSLSFVLGAHIAFGCLGFFVSSEWNSSSALSFMSLTELKSTDQLLCRMTFNLVLSDISRCIQVVHLGQEITNVMMCPSVSHITRCIMPICAFTDDRNFGHLIMVASAWFLYGKVMGLSFFSNM